MSLKNMNYDKKKAYCIVKSYPFEHASYSYGFDKSPINMSDEAHAKIKKLETIPPDEVVYIGDDHTIFNMMQRYINNIKKFEAQLGADYVTAIIISEPRTFTKYGVFRCDCREDCEEKMNERDVDYQSLIIVYYRYPRPLCVECRKPVNDICSDNIHPCRYEKIDALPCQCNYQCTYQCKVCDNLNICIDCISSDDYSSDEEDDDNDDNENEKFEETIII